MGTGVPPDIQGVNLKFKPKRHSYFWDGVEEGLQNLQYLRARMSIIAYIYQIAALPPPLNPVSNSRQFYNITMCLASFFPFSSYSHPQNLEYY